MLTLDQLTQTNPEAQSGVNHLLLKRLLLIKAVVTPLWKDEAEQQLQAQVKQLEEQLQQLDTQVQQMVGELSKRAVQIIGLENSGIAETQSQIQDIQMHASERKTELLEQKTQVLAQLKQVQDLELGEEVEQGQVDNFFYAKQGDHLIHKMQVEVLLRNGMIEEIRGEL